MRGFYWLVLLCLGLCAALAAAERPNVVVFLTDDQGWGDLSINGNTNLATPNIDQLAREGAQFDRFYVCPVCSPTRAEFLTGRYHTRLGVYSTSAGGERMNLGETTIADAFKRGGYSTGAFGKWHNGMQAPYHPNTRGFDEFYGFCSGHWGHYFDPMLERNGEIVTGKGFCVDDFTTQAMAFMEESAKAKKPFFAYIPYNTPHSPMQVPDKWWDKFGDLDQPLAMRNREPNKEKPLHLRAALAMCENIDWNVGRVTAKLDALGLADNTIVVYFCDNGPNGVRWNGDMKGRKGSTDEGGVRSPLIVRYPARVRAGTNVRGITHVTDLLPTLAALCGVKPDIGKSLDGRDRSRALLGKEEIDGTRIIYNTWKSRLSLRTQQFRLDHKGKLFEMAKDPGQRKDVSSKYPREAKRLRGAQKAFAEKHLEPPKDERPFVIGHPAMSLTQVPARDGTAHGGIKRSNKFPNASFFTNWTSKDDKITWVTEIGEAGTYDIDMYYSCPAADVGSTLELRFDQAGRTTSKLSARITEAHDPPFIGGAADRFPRVESEEKVWTSMNLGSLVLPKGKGTLVLQATNIPGGQVMDFRLLRLRRR